MSEENFVTVFTPTYNRAEIIEKLYKSLCSQSYKNFEWLVVDDGSIDNTASIIQEYIRESKIKIRFFKQPNGGKHRAINKGVSEAKGNVFYIVDSDDFLLSDSLKIINTYFNKVVSDKAIAGVSGIMSYPSGKIIGSGINDDMIEASALEIRMKYKVKGDLSEAFRTDVLREFPFPEFENEKFCPEALIWYRIAQKYKILYFNKVIYVRDYLEGGLTSKIVRIRRESPRATLLYYSELSNYQIPRIQKIKAFINYWRFSFCSRASFQEKINQIGLLSIIFFPIGLLFYIFDSKV